MNSDTAESRRLDRAVSPVIGVILMVAITVILAAVIGAFVLEIGDQQETAPNTSFDSDEKHVFMRAGNSVDAVNATRVTVSHAGGDVVTVSNIKLAVDGNPGAWTLEAGENSDVVKNTDRIPAKPQPDLTKALGTNDPVRITSGEELSVMAYGTRPLREYVQAGANYEFSAFTVKKGGGSEDHTSDFTEGVPRLFVDNLDANGNTKMANPELTNKDRDDETVFLLSADESVQLIWEAESGGKTQTLFKYDVQRGSPDF